LGQSQTYTRDARGLITRIAAAAGNFDFSFDLIGRRAELAYPNGSTARYAFDAAGQLTNLTHAGVFNVPYTHSFDAAGRITRVTGDGPDWNYSYDVLGRLIRATHATSTYAYTLDAVGNILDNERSYDVNHRLIADANKNFSYDQRGNLTLEQDRATGARVAYAWNVKNQLLRVDFFANATATTPARTLQYSYDPLGRRATKTDGGVVQRFTYDGDDLVGTLNSSGNVVAATVFSGMIDEALSSTTGATPRTLYSDHLGSVIGVADGTTPTHSYSYGPYGETTAPSSVDSLPFRYTGREKDTDSLYYYRARYYHTGMGRFISADPIGLGGGLSLYAYVGANPVSIVDPLGTQPGSPDWCRRQADRIRNIEQKIRERIGELDENPLDLPEACPGDDLKPSLSRRGHRKLINMDKANLAVQQALYLAFCSGGPPLVPVPVPVKNPQPAPPSNSPFSLEYWEALTGLTGAALIAYLIVSEGSRFFPLRNLVPLL
jgi:RHS repeat-associated protein